MLKSRVWKPWVSYYASHCRNCILPLLSLLVSATFFSVTLVMTSCRVEEGHESYHQGGFHPVHLGDVFNGRYEVLRKLGYVCAPQYGY